MNKILKEELEQENKELSNTLYNLENDVRIIKDESKEVKEQLKNSLDSQIIFLRGLVASRFALYEEVELDKDNGRIQKRKGRNLPTNNWSNLR